MKLLYRGSTDGFTAKDFTSKCNKKGETLILVKTTTNNIFGAYTNIEWDSKNEYDKDVVKKGEGKSRIISYKDDGTIFQFYSKNGTTEVTHHQAS